MTIETIEMKNEGRLRQPGVRAWLRLMRIYQRIERVAGDHVRQYGLSLAQFYVLTHVGAAPGLVQQALADGLLVTKGNIVQLLDRMELSGLIERRREGRANRLYLTPTGQALYDTVVPMHEEVIAQQFDTLDAHERLQLLRLLRKLDRRLPG
jgi:MarR family transcriptional regulator, 2-MHQ and catechol-resistance regulon repressor